MKQMLMEIYLKQVKITSSLAPQNQGLFSGRMMNPVILIIFRHTLKHNIKFRIARNTAGRVSDGGGLAGGTGRLGWVEVGVE